MGNCGVRKEQAVGTAVNKTLIENLIVEMGGEVVERIEREDSHGILEGIVGLSADSEYERSGYSWGRAIGRWQLNQHAIVILREQGDRVHHLLRQGHERQLAVPGSTATEVHRRRLSAEAPSAKADHNDAIEH